MSQQKQPVVNSGGLTIAGIVVSGGSFFMTTTVDNDTLGSATHNIGLMQTQMMVLHVGLAMFVAGVVLSLRDMRGTNDTASGVEPGAAVRELTDEEREARDDANRRSTRLLWIVLAVILVAVVGATVLENFGSNPDSSVNMMNVDATMNTELIDGAMNADANMAADANMSMNGDALSADDTVSDTAAVDGAMNADANMAADANMTMDVENMTMDDE